VIPVSSCRVHCPYLLLGLCGLRLFVVAAAVDAIVLIGFVMVCAGRTGLSVRGRSRRLVVVVVAVLGTPVLPQ
jgi:hypothetical protein